MKVDVFTESLQHPPNLDGESIGELSELVKRFPYCQSARILLTMALFKENHFGYEDELKATAIYVGDRKIFKQHIDKLSHGPEPLILPDEHIEVEADKVETSTEEILVVEEETEVKEVEDVVAHEEEAIHKPEVESTAVEEQQTALPPEEVKKEVPDDKEEQKDESVEEKPDTLSELKRIVAERLKQIELEKEKVEDPKEKEQPAESKTGQSTSELINKFIKSEPSITRHKAAFFNPAEAARESIVDEENIVSETLARIYYDQRKYQKAIAVYKKLSLKYPEKSSYFAALIEKAIEELKK